MAFNEKNPPTCAKCGDKYLIDDGMEQVPYCEGCLQEESLEQKEMARGGREASGGGRA